MRVKFFCVSILITAALLGALALNAAAGKVFWYLPHPDDETLGMADSIHQSVLDGNENSLIYFTKGTGSLARFFLTGPDGQSYQLTKEEFGQARMAETLAALAVLGISPEQVVFLDYEDGGVPQKTPKRLCGLWQNQIQGASTAQYISWTGTPTTRLWPGLWLQ